MNMPFGLQLDINKLSNNLIIQFGKGPEQNVSKDSHQTVNITLPTSFTSLFKSSVATVGWDADIVTIFNTTSSILNVSYFNWRYDTHSIGVQFISIGY